MRMGVPAFVLAMGIVLLAGAGCGKKKADASGGGGGEGAVTEYQRKSMSSEATMSLRKIYDGARAYYEEDAVGRDGTILPKQFPASATMTPPPGVCCKGEHGRCAPDASTWEDAAWQALRFSMEDPYYYSYEFVASGTGPGASFTARAVGDLDCDGVFSTFEIAGHVGEDGSLSSPSVFKKNELE